MDIIISASDEVKRIMKEITLDEDNRINPEEFQDMMILIANRKEKDNV